MTFLRSPSDRSTPRGKARRACAALLLAGLLAAGACGDTGSDEPGGSSTTTSAAAQPQTFSQGDTGKEALLAVGEEAVVSLETCGGCGYQWRVTEAPDEAIIESLGSTNQPRPTSTQPGDAPIVGAPTDEIFRFRGVSAGRTEVTLGYFPPAGAAPEESFTLTFVVA